MKKSFFLLAAVVLAGCSSDDATVTSKSPWSADGNTGSTGNPMSVAVSSRPEVPQYQGVANHQYSWDTDGTLVAKPAEDVAPTAPEDATKGRVSEVAGTYGMFSFLSTEKPPVGTTLLVTKDKQGARIRVKEIDGDAIIAEILPNQLDVPALAVNDEFSISPDPMAVVEAPAAQ